MAVTLGSKGVGSFVRLRIGGSYYNFIVAQHGRPSGLYDSGFNGGTLLLLQGTYGSQSYGSSPNYASSQMHSYLNGSFFYQIEEGIRNAIKTVRIPYCPSSSSSVLSGGSGLSTKVFLLSTTELGFENDVNNINGQGTTLSYFSGCSKSGSDSRRNAGSDYFTRSPNTASSSYVTYIGTDGNSWSALPRASDGVRPAFVLPQSLYVADDSSVFANTAPSITADAVALGEQNAAFAFDYTVSDVDGDTMTVTEKLDGKTTKTRTGIASGTALTFEQAADTAAFQKILNGQHTIAIEASDGKEITSISTTFTKVVTAACITLAEPMEADAQITLCAITVSGSIPADAVFKVEVTNNGKDDSPVWEDATTAARNSRNHPFANQTADKGFAFNIRVTVKRGASGESGYITSVQGGFQ